MMRILASGICILLATACRGTGEAGLKGDELATGSRSLPREAQALWDAYVREETSKARLQTSCIPLQLRPPEASEDRGLLVMYHGFSGCPNQFVNVGRKLADMGFHVLFPLLPGQGRVPLAIDRAAGTVADDDTAMPRDEAPYRELSGKMNAIARLYPGVRVVAGLSGGGGQATGTVAAGQDSALATNLWHRALFMVPLYQIPGLQGHAADVVSLSLPSFNAGFGASCEAAQLDEAEPRVGMCDFKLAHVQAMEAYGREAAKKGPSFTIPIQIVGVEGDQASDNGAINAFHKRLGSQDKSLCFYRKGVEHAMLYEGDYLHPDTRPWVPDVERMVIEWVKDGRHVETRGGSSEHGQPSCKLSVDLPAPRG